MPIIQNINIDPFSDRVTFTENGSWTCPSDVYSVLVYGYGGGGGNGGNGSNGGSPYGITPSNPPANSGASGANGKIVIIPLKK